MIGMRITEAHVSPFVPLALSHSLPHTQSLSLTRITVTFFKYLTTQFELERALNFVSI